MVSLNYDSLLVDLETYWTQLAQYREGFTYTETEVNIPNFFVKINGVHSKPKEYDKYVERFENAPNTLVFDSVAEFEKHLNHLSVKKIKKIKKKSLNIPKDEMSIKKIREIEWNSTQKELFESFISRAEGLDKEEIRFCNVSRKQKENLERAYNIVINEYKQYFPSYADNNRFDKCCCVISDDFIRVLNSFDYSREIPKIIIKVQKDEYLSEFDCLWLAFFNELCFDILIFSPEGTINIESYLDINVFSLDNFKESEKFEIKNDCEGTNNHFIIGLNIVCILAFVSLIPFVKSLNMVAIVIELIVAQIPFIFFSVVPKGSITENNVYSFFACIINSFVLEVIACIIIGSA